MKRTSKKNIQASKVPNKKQKPVSKPVKTSFLLQNLKYLFLLFILSGIADDLFFSFSFGNIFSEATKNVLTIFAVVTGIISLYFEKNKLVKIVDKLFMSDKSDKPKYKFFDKIKSSLSKKEFPTTFVFIVILGISVFTLFYKLGNFDLYSDEISVTRGAAGYMHTGEYKQWDFIKGETVEKSYNRAKPHQFITAQSFNLFGINAWSARFPSAFIGVLLIVFLFFIGKYFIKDKRAVLLTIFSLALYFDFLALGRWARMYAMVFPLFLLAYYWTFKFLTETNNYKLFNSEKYPILKKYFNFNYIFLPFIAGLLYINLFTHQNSALIFPVFLLFSVLSIFLFNKEKKYITASIVTIGILIIQIISPFKVGFSRFTLFEINHAEHYSNILFGYPFSASTNIIFLSVGLFSYFLVKNERFRKSYLALIITAALTWILFSYVFDYPSHFRYVSFVTPIIILLIIGFYTLIGRLLFNKAIQIILAILIIFSVLIQFKNNYDSLYVTNTLSPAKPSVAYKTIKKNIKDGDVIFRHWGPRLYLKGINPETKFISLGSYKGRSFVDLYNELRSNKSGWIVWHTYNGGRINQQFQNYVNLYFKKYHGYGVDKTGEEIYYYNQNMMVPLEQFFTQQSFPVANLNLNNSYSIAFSLQIDSLSEGTIFTLKSDSIINYNFTLKSDSLFVIRNNNKTISVELNSNERNNIVWFQDNQARKTKQGLFLKDEIISEKEIILQDSLTKFQINPYFNGNIDKIRIYNFVLSKTQVQAIISDNKTVKSSEILIADDKEFNTLYLWQKK